MFVNCWGLVSFKHLRHFLSVLAAGAIAIHVGSLLLVTTRSMQGEGGAPIALVAVTTVCEARLAMNSSDDCSKTLFELAKKQELTRLLGISTIMHMGTISQRCVTSRLNC